MEHEIQKTGLQSIKYFANFPNDDHQVPSTIHNCIRVDQEFVLIPEFIQARGLLYFIKLIIFLRTFLFIPTQKS